MCVLWIVSISLLGMYISLMTAYAAGYRKNRNRNDSTLRAIDPSAPPSGESSVRPSGDPSVRPSGESSNSPSGGLTVVVPLRNEAVNLGGLLQDLSRQDYPEEMLEVIFVDDHSTDDTFDILAGKIEGKGNFRLRQLGPGSSGKKDALHEGILSASHSRILNTDADCRFGSGWCSGIASCLAADNTRMVIGPVLMDPSTGFFGSLQSLEMFSLSLVTGGSAGLQHPILCNGANLAYYREDYLDFERQHTRLSESGDDVFLMHWLKRSRRGKIVYPEGKGTAVRISPSTNLKTFLRQRLRWASKTTLLADFHFLFSALAVYGLNFMIFIFLLAILGLSWQDPSRAVQFLFLPGVLLLGKLLTDLAVLLPLLRRHGKMNLIWFLLPGEIAYFVYVSLVGFFSQFVKVTWKGRKI